MTPYRNKRWLGCLAASVLIHAAVLAWVGFSAGGDGSVSATIRVMLASAGDDAAGHTPAPGAWQPASATRSRDLFARAPAPETPNEAVRPDPKAESAPKPTVDVKAAPGIESPPPEKAAPQQAKAMASATRSAQIAATTSKVEAKPDKPASSPAFAGTTGESHDAATSAAVTASSSGSGAGGAPQALSRTSGRIAGDTVADTGELLALLHQAIDRSKQYPSLARRQRREGTATVRFRLSPSGEMDAIDIDRSSGFGMLDTAAITAVSRVAPFAPARTLLSEITRFKVNVTFRLN